MTSALLEWRDVRTRLGGRPVLDGFTLSVTRAESLALLGASGSGKSVALRHLVGLMRPDEGQVVVDGQDLARATEASWVPVRRRVAMVFQGGALFDSLTVGENVSFGLREHHPEWDGARLDARVAEVLAWVDLAGTEAVMPADLSGGMRKRVALARALALGPEALLCDEPTAGLDPVTARRVADLIRSLQRRLGVTLVVVTHDVETARATADRLAFLEGGRIRFDGSVAAGLAASEGPLAAFLSGAGVDRAGS